VTWSPLVAHAAALACVGVDVGVRAWRLGAYARAFGHPIGRWDAVRVNLVSDAGSALTPLRLGGEPMRLLAMLGAGVPATACFALLAAEVIITWPLTLLVGLGLAAAFAPAWMVTAAPQIARAVAANLPAVIVVLVLSALALGFGWHWLRAAGRRPARSVARLRVYWRRLPLSVLILSGGLTLITVGARVAVLPLLGLAQAGHPPVGVMLMGSYGLVYSQLFLPTPSGVGAVEFGFLAGAAGGFGGGEGRLLGWWRWYTSGLPAVAGLLVAVRMVGWRALAHLGRRVAHPPGTGA
jgi:uncharacterized membrane protein YbhN (UPF0104 family)